MDFDSKHSKKHFFSYPITTIDIFTLFRYHTNTRCANIGTTGQLIVITDIRKTGLAPFPNIQERFKRNANDGKKDRAAVHTLKNLDRG